MIKSVILIAVFLILLPFLLGLLYTRFVEEEKNSIFLNIAAGYIMAMGLFEIVTLPLIWMGQSLKVLLVVYGGILFAAAVISLILNWRRFGEVLLDTVQMVRSFTLCIWMELVLIAGQIFIYVRYEYMNADDAYFVASATTSIATNTIFAYNPYTGNAYENLPSRYVLSPFHAFIAVVSEAVDTHPAILTHSVFMILFLLLAYAVYALIGRALFAKDSEKTGYFLVILSALNIFAAYSERTSGLFLLIRLWQGKAILAGILLPLILYLVLRIFLLEGKRADWFLLFGLMCACCMVSSMGIMLAAIMLGIFGILFAWKHKSIRILFYTAACCIPNVICAGIYLVIK